MSKLALKVENLSKLYRLGEVGTGTLSHDFQRWWNRVRGKEDPFSRVGETNVRDKVGNSDYVWALKDINFEVKKGEILGIIGRNGAGKSTLLKILSKVTGPTKGRIRAKGRVASLLEVGTGFHYELTGRENVYLNGTILGMTKKEVSAKLDEIVDFSGVERYLDTPVKRYSSGMKVRLGFAVAAHLDPEILIVDEVLAVGDLEFQKKCIGKMESVSSKEGRTILFVSHNMTLVENLCHRCIIMENGVVNKEGKTSQMIEYYRNATLQIANTNLFERTDRTGNGLVRFKEITFNNGNVIFVGKPLAIELLLKANENIEKLQVVLTICRGYEERLMVIDTKSQGVQLKVEKGENRLHITLPKIYLLPGSYNLILWAGGASGVLDCVRSGGNFEVAEADIFNSGYMLNTSQHGVFFPDKCQWTLKKA